jgi:hypothetical protein
LAAVYAATLWADRASLHAFSTTGSRKLITRPGLAPGRSPSSSGRGRCPLPKEPRAERPGRTTRPDVQAAVVAGRRICKHGRGPLPARISRPRTSPARTSPPHPGHRMREFLKAGNERRVRLSPHRRAGPIPAHRPRLSRRCTVPARSCCHHDDALSQGFTPVPGQPPQGRRDCVVTPPVRFPGCEPAPSGLHDCRHCPRARWDPG